MCRVTVTVFIWILRILASLSVTVVPLFIIISVQSHVSLIIPRLARCIINILPETFRLIAFKDNIIPSPLVK